MLELKIDGIILYYKDIKIPLINSIIKHTVLFQLK